MKRSNRVRLRSEDVVAKLRQADEAKAIGTPNAQVMVTCRFKGKADAAPLLPGRLCNHLVMTTPPRVCDLDSRDFEESLPRTTSRNAAERARWRFCFWRTSGGAPAVTPDGKLDKARFMHHGADWRLLEERVDDAFILNDWNAGTYAASSIDRTEQHVWGLRYIDDAVLHRIDANKDGDYTDAGDGTWYHLTDAQFSSVCLVDPAGVVAERVSYSAYGIARHHWQGDVDGDGAVTVAGGTSDLGLVTAASGSSIGGAGYRSEYDLDRDGDVDSADQSRVGSATAALPAGQLSPVTASGPDSQAGWDGYLYAAETGLYAVRYRTYEPGLGRWVERDPAGYADGVSLMEYARSTPRTTSDPSGMWIGLYFWMRGQGQSGGSPPNNGPIAPDVNPTQDRIPQCKDEKGQPVQLTFNGSTLEGNGFCATAVSGRHSGASIKETNTSDGQYIETTLIFDYSMARQRQRNVGPTPEGCYFIRTDHEDSATGTNNPKGEPSRRHGWPKSSAWGDYSWPLTPYPETDVNDEEGNPRSGMFLHGGSDPGSAGCVDVCNHDDNALHDFMDRIRKVNASPCFVKVCARYGRKPASIVQKKFNRNYTRCGCSISPWMPK